MSSSSCMVASRWAQFCRTAPSICNGHPTGICDCSRSPSPFCSMIVPSIGTSIVAFRLICARLQFHVSGASKPRLASSASAGNSGLFLERQCFLLYYKFKAMHRFLFCLRGRFIGRCYIFKPGGAEQTSPLLYLAELAFLTLSRRRLWYISGIIHAGTNTVMNCTFQTICRSLGLKSGEMHLTCPSMIRRLWLRSVKRCGDFEAKV